MDKKEKKDVRILSEKVLYKGFNFLKEYDLQHPSMQNGQDYCTPINREIMICADAVSVLLYIHQADSFLFCEQFRTGPFFNESSDNCFLFEIPAGIIDPGFSPEKTAFKEVFEETGITIDHVEKIYESYASTGRMTEKNYLYYAEIDTIPETGLYGCDSEGEEIKTHIIPRLKTYDMMARNEFLHVQTLLALNWFKTEKDYKKG